MGKPKHYDPDWKIEDDEYHPNVKQAAYYADLTAAITARAYCHKQILRLENTPITELTPSDVAELERLRDELAMRDEDIKVRKEEPSDEV